MDIYSIERFCDRWIEKANSYRANDLESLFDRFFTLFVAYNRVYSATAELYRAKLDDKRAKMLQGDRKEATIIMKYCITQRRFDDAVSENPAIADACQTIATLLQNHRFFLHSNRSTREPDVARDLRVADGLQKYSLIAVLECLYQIRCNIFHGEKEFAPRQAELLAPSITLLEKIVSLSKEALFDAAH